MDQNLEWIQDCMQVHRRVLSGEFSHRCPDWSGRPIDETCDEFEACACYDDQRRRRRVRFNGHAHL